MNVRECETTQIIVERFFFFFSTFFFFVIFSSVTKDWLATRVTSIEFIAETRDVEKRWKKDKMKMKRANARTGTTKTSFVFMFCCCYCYCFLSYIWKFYHQQCRHSVSTSNREQFSRRFLCFFIFFRVKLMNNEKWQWQLCAQAWKETN